MARVVRYGARRDVGEGGTRLRLGRHIVPVQRNASSGTANTRFCVSVPCSISNEALASVSIAGARLCPEAPKMTLDARSTVRGSCMPPNSTS